jgi:hypothetical protein
VDAVLGLSVTPSAVGLVLVEGQDADGATVDRDTFDVGFRGRASAAQTSEQAAAAVLRSEAIATTRGTVSIPSVSPGRRRQHRASLLLKSTDSGFDNVVPCDCQATGHWRGGSPSHRLRRHRGVRAGARNGDR